MTPRVRGVTQMDSWRHEYLIDGIREILDLKPLYPKKAVSETRRHFTRAMESVAGDGNRRTGTSVD